MRIDLHTHSYRSDGTDSPSELVQKAAAAGLDVVALTDHDAMTGWDEAQQAADRVGITLVKGIEISTLLDGQSVHLLAYEPDPHDPALLAELRRVLDGRDQRLPLVLEKLAQHGVDLTIDDVVAQSGSAAASGRPHIADAMVAKGYLQHRDDAFDGWLNRKGRAYVDRYAAPLVETIGLVKAAGGKAVVAHPWSRDSGRVLTPDVFEGLVDVGLDGLEVDHVDHDERTRAELHDLARSLGIVATGSSDYHGTGKSAAFALGAHTTAPDQYERLLGR